MANALETLSRKLRASFVPKLLFIAFLTLLLLIPVDMINSISHERYNRRDMAIEEVQSRWGTGQTIGGAILTIPYTTVHYAEKDSIVTLHYAHFLPDSIMLHADVQPELRHRGIFDVLLYRAAIHLQGRFTRPDFGRWSVPAHRIHYDKAVLTIGINDTRGIKDHVTLNWNGRSFECGPCAAGNKLFANGLQVALNLSEQSTARSFHFATQLTLNGSEELYFLPLGKWSGVQVTSSWSSPAFTGAFLPDRHDIDAAGFRAEWNVSYLGRAYPQQWLDGDVQVPDMDGTAFGVNFYIPVDNYQQSIRAGKYAILFVLLTFTAFFMFEILGKLHIHPAQYLLVGLTVCLFYLLLLSLCEHLGFSSAYMCAASVTILTLTLYSGSVLADRKRAALMFALSSVLYAVLYVLLRLEDYSLLVGAVALFLALALIMYITRNIDWYTVASSRVDESAESVSPPATGISPDRH